jgi:hypothetical protein
MASESILPRAWSQGHYDWKYIKCIQKRFGTKKLSTFPHYGFFGYLTYYFTNSNFSWRVKKISILDYISYNKIEAKNIISRELKWRDYGGKHCESNYTKIYQSYILPEKFGYDKRRAHLSSLICSNQISREEAILQIELPVYTKIELENDISYLINKFDITRETLNYIMTLPAKTYSDYANYQDSFYFKFFKQFLALLIWIRKLLR